MACARDSSRGGGGWGCTRKCATNARGVGVHRKNEVSTAGFDPQSLKNFQTIPYFWSSALCKWNFCLSGRNERRGKGFRRRKDMRSSSSSSSSRKGRREEGNNQWRTESKRRTSECRKGKEKGAGGGVALECCWKMPLVRYELRSELMLANPQLYRTARKDDSEAVLEGVAMAALVGIVRQLGDLAEYVFFFSVCLSLTYTHISYTFSQCWRRSSRDQSLSLRSFFATNFWWFLYTKSSPMNSINAGRVWWGRRILPCLLQCLPILVRTNGCLPFSQSAPWMMYLYLTFGKKTCWDLMDRGGFADLQLRFSMVCMMKWCQSWGAAMSWEQECWN
jgi:hypothetical protein